VRIAALALVLAGCAIQPPPNTYLDVARQRYNDHAYADAISIVQASRSHDDLDSRELIAMSLERLGSPDGIRTLDEILRTHPERFHAALAVGEHYARINPHRATLAFELYLLHRPLEAAVHDDEVRARLAACRLRAREWAIARREYETLLARAPDNAAYRAGLAAALVGEQRCEDAIVVLEAVPREDRLQASVAFNLASCYFEVGRIEEALREAGGYTAAHADDAKGWLLLGRAASAAKRYDAALDAYQRARGLLPSDVRVLVNVAELELALHRRDEAMHTLDEALRLDPNDATVLRLRERMAPR
jgi:predicted Zn-dependent protease